jgi:hypothetical protein
MWGKRVQLLSQTEHSREQGPASKYFDLFLLLYKRVSRPEISLRRVLAETRLRRKGTELQISVAYRGLHFLSPRIEEIVQEYKPAIDIYEDEFAWWTREQY